ncbi:MAG TPA: hypothetical protein VFK33_07580 [Bacillales bacterium]|nr:hypothetical protein [Bacillales bacterium]
MIHVIEILAKIVNGLHDLLIFLSHSLGFGLTDKQLHFWVIGFIGIVSFLIVQGLFRWLSRYSITAISLIYTMTLLIIFVFAIEIEQKITGRGSMEFEDAVIGLWGFILFFSIYAAIRLLIYTIARASRKKKKAYKHERSL